MPDPRLYMRVLAVVRERIADGTYPAGSRLPPFAVMAHEQDVGRDTVQHAYQLAEREGLAVRYAGLGYYVSDNPPQ